MVKFRKLVAENTVIVAEKSPKGFKGTVKAMKKHKNISNPWALAWSMKKKGYKSHKKANGSAKNESINVGASCNHPLYGNGVVRKVTNDGFIIEWSNLNKRINSPTILPLSEMKYLVVTNEGDYSNNPLDLKTPPVMNKKRTQKDKVNMKKPVKESKRPKNSTTQKSKTKLDEGIIGMVPIVGMPLFNTKKDYFDLSFDDIVMEQDAPNPSETILTNTTGSSKKSSEPFSSMDGANSAKDGVRDDMKLPDDMLGDVDVLEIKDIIKGKSMKSKSKPKKEEMRNVQEPSKKEKSTASEPKREEQVEESLSWDDIVMVENTEDSFKIGVTNSNNHGTPKKSNMATNADGNMADGFGDDNKGKEISPNAAGNMADGLNKDSKSPMKMDETKMKNKKMKECSGSKTKKVKENYGNLEEHNMAAGEIAMTQELFSEIAQAIVRDNLDEENIRIIAQALAGCCEEDRTLDVSDHDMIMDKVKELSGGEEPTDDEMGDDEMGGEEPEETMESSDESETEEDDEDAFEDKAKGDGKVAGQEGGREHAGKTKLMDEEGEPEEGEDMSGEDDERLTESRKTSSKRTSIGQYADDIYETYSEKDFDKLLEQISRRSSQKWY